MHIDKVLLADAHILGGLDRAGMLLHRDAGVGWLILVPDTPAVDWQELDATAYRQFTRQLRSLSAFAARYFHAGKMNVAALGNATRQMHVHVIARFHDDRCGPRSAWGRRDSAHRYRAVRIDALRGALADALGLVPGGLA